MSAQAGPAGARRAAAILLPIAAVVVAMAAYQVGAAVAKSLFPAVGAEGAATLRLVLAAAMMGAIVRPWRNWQAPWLPVLGLGVSMGGVILMFYLALTRLSLGVAISLQFLGPLAIALSASRRPLDLLWAGLAAAGVWGLVGPASGAVRIDALGIGYALGAAAGWAGYILCGRAASAAGGRHAAAAAMAIAALLVAPIGIAHAGAALLSPALIPLALAVALFSTAIPFSLELYALPRMPARTFSVFMSLEPAFGALSGLVLLHEQLSLTQTAGLCAVVFAAAGAAWSSAGERTPEVTEAPPA